MTDIIRDVQKFKKGWHSGLPETPCGFGSRLSNTKLQRQWIPEIVKKYGIKTVADIGAGDLNWISQMTWDVEYSAYDLIPRHSSVKHFDIVTEVAPKVDMLMCFWVLNHLPKRDSALAIGNLKASGSKYLMMTDRPIWRQYHPKEILMPYIEKIILNHKKDCIMLVDLESSWD